MSSGRRARSGTRTRTPLRTMVFETIAFADYAIRARGADWHAGECIAAAVDPTIGTGRRLVPSWRRTVSAALPGHGARRT